MNNVIKLLSERNLVDRLRSIALIPDPITTANEAADRIEQLLVTIKNFQTVNDNWQILMQKARSDALEEAAKVADEYKGLVRAELVAGIRAMKEKT